MSLEKDYEARGTPLAGRLLRRLGPRSGLDPGEDARESQRERGKGLGQEARRDAVGGQGDIGGHRDDDAMLWQRHERGEATNRGAAVPEYHRGLRVWTQGGGPDKPAEAVPRLVAGLELNRRAQYVERLRA